MQIVFWQNTLSFYQAPHIRALADMGHDVTWVAEDALTADRKAQGWALAEAGNAKIVVAPSGETIDTLLRQQNKYTTNIFTGIGAFPMVKDAFYKCVATPARIGLLVENRDDRGWKGAARLLRHKHDFAAFGSRIGFILAMGYYGEHGGRRWYKRCGYPDSAIFPYGYFPDGPKSYPVNETAADGPVELVYVGQFVPRKGGDLLIKALSSLREMDWHINMIGDGASKSGWIDAARRRHIEHRISFHTSMANVQAMEFVAAADIFVLPSRFDGWGVVINESLLRGVPVICSDRCGAADLLQDSWRGGIFQSGSVLSLVTHLQQWIGKGKKSVADTTRIREWSRCIEGDVAANYLYSIIESAYDNGERPAPPWRT